MTLYEYIPEIKNTPLFKDVSPDYTQRYINEKSFRVLKFNQHDTVYSQASADSCVGIILNGIATVSSDTGNSNFTLRTLSRGDIFGIANLYAKEKPFPSVICAKSSLECILINGNAFREFIENDPNILRKYLSLLSNKIVYLNQKISVFSAGSTEKKLAVFISENQVGGKLELSYSMSYLATALGVGRASLYRAIDKLSELGLIVRNEKHIHVPSIENLKKFFS
jgi:CRP-like cAMP-binding protein